MKSITCLVLMVISTLCVYGQTNVDCDVGPINTTFCYTNNDNTQFTFTSSTGLPLNVQFNAGQVENSFDQLIILDTDGVTNLNGASPYGNNGDLTGLSFLSTGDTITVAIQSDGSINCQGNGFTPWDFDVWCQTCEVQTVDYLINGDCDTSEFTIDVNITDLGSATSLTVSDDQGSGDQVTTEVGSLTFGPYTANTNVIITTANADDVNCIITSSPLTFICPPPPNECSVIFAGDDQSVSCENPSTALTAFYMSNGIDQNLYEINQLDSCPTPPLTGGSPSGIDIDDRWSQVIDMTFDFCFFGNTYNQLLIGANGLITFDTIDAGQFCPWAFSESVPDPDLPLNAIYGAYHDINPAVCGNIEYFVLGSAPARQFVVNFTAACQFSCTNLESTQQIILYESSNNIDVNIFDKPTCASWNSGNAVIGVQNTDGTIGFTPPNRNTGPWTATNEFWRFAPGGSPNNTFEWFDGDMNSLGNTDTITVEPLETTTYTASVSFEKCDGSTVSITDQVTITVETSDITISQPEDLEECASGSNGFGTFDLSAQDTIILNGLSGYSVSYHLSLADAETGDNSIPTPMTYNAISNPQTLFARVEKDSSTNCFKTISFTLTAIQCAFPQGISPNGDGLNDRFDLSNFDVTSIEIFNRNGVSVYSRQNYSDEWEGQADDGKELPVGTYFYVMRYQNGKERSAWVYLNK